MLHKIINSALNIFSFHYSLWFSALTPIYGYYSVYAKLYANASSSQYGFLNMILTFASIAAKIFFCSMADRHRAYRSFFIWFLFISFIGYASFATLPFFVAYGKNDSTENSSVNYPIWILICFMTSMTVISMSVISCLSDAFAMNWSKKKNLSYGSLRLWGTLGWGISSLVLIQLNKAFNSASPLVPGLIMTSILVLVDLCVQIVWPRHEDYNLDESASEFNFGGLMNEENKLTNNKLTSNCNNHVQSDNYGTNNQGDATGQQDELEWMKESNIVVQWRLFKEVAKRRKSLYRYMMLFTISGALASLQWSYMFLFLEKIYNEEDFKFVSALSMVGQSFLGELPFFILSKYIIKLLGRSNTLSISFISIGVRYLLYNYLLSNSTSMYYVLLTESLQGPSFGLFYVVMIEVGLDYSDCEDGILKMIDKGLVGNSEDRIQKLRHALRATMQSLMSACYEGLGMGIGSIVGGLVIEYGNFSALWFWAAITAIVLGLFNLMIDRLNLPILVD